MIGADGARSAIRSSLAISFESFTWSECYLIVSTPFDFTKVIPDLACVSYFADAERCFFLLQIPGLWSGHRSNPVLSPNRAGTGSNATLAIQSA